MPLYEYTCEACQKRSEILIKGSGEPTACPECGSHDLHKEFSTFSTNGETHSGGSGAGHAHSPGCGCCMGPQSACGLN